MPLCKSAYFYACSLKPKPESLNSLHNGLFLVKLIHSDIDPPHWRAWFEEVKDSTDFVFVSSKGNPSFIFNGFILKITPSDEMRSCLKYHALTAKLLRMKAAAAQALNSFKPPSPR